MSRTYAQSKAQQRMAWSGAANADRTSPLRKVVRRVHTYLVGHEGGHTFERLLLECGHVVRLPQSVYGGIVYDRRRCLPCAKGLPAGPSEGEVLA